MALSLYLISPPAIGGDFFYRLERALHGNNVPRFQLRLKGAGKTAILAAARKCERICRRHGTLFYVNDYPDIALACGAHGVHIGADDGAVAACDKKLAVGVSCYNDIGRALKAAEAGAEYVSFGAFFHTTTKNPPAKAEPALLAQWKRRRPDVPVCAIGGINADNIGVIAAAGADYAAVISAVWDAPEGEERATARLDEAARAGVPA